MRCTLLLVALVLAAWPAFLAALRVPAGGQTHDAAPSRRRLSQMFPMSLRSSKDTSQATNTTVQKVVDPKLEMEQKAVQLRNTWETEALVAAYTKAHDTVRDSWKYSPSLLCMGAKVHGQQNKESKDFPWRVWEIERIRMSKPYQSVRNLPSSMTIYSGSEGYISTKYKFIYLRSQKSSSSTILKALRDTFCLPTGVCTADELQKWDRIPDDEIYNSYFVFTWVRNPWQRIASAYIFTSQFLRVRVPGQFAPGPPCGVPFSEFAKDPFSLIRACDERSCCPFYQGRWDFDFIGGHLNDQASVAFGTNGRALVDFIGRTENIEEDWKEMMQIFNERSGFRHKTVQIERWNIAEIEEEPLADAETVHDCTKFGMYLNETTMQSLAVAYAMDVHRLGYHLDETHAE